MTCLECKWFVVGATFGAGPVNYCNRYPHYFHRRDEDPACGEFKPAKAAPTKRFVPPTTIEVKEYAESIGYRLDAEAFCSHYDSNGWKVGKNKMKDWRAAVRTWKRNATPDELVGNDGFDLRELRKEGA